MRRAGTASPCGAARLGLTVVVSLLVSSCADARQLFRRPASPWVAEFLGAENVFAGVVRVADRARAPGTGSDGDDAFASFKAMAVHFC